MNLHNITDAEDNCDDFGWSIAVWAETPDDAERYARENYAGEGPADEVENLVRWCGLTLPGGEIQPAQEGTHEETRPQVLRIAGWRYEMESPCDCCGLFAFGMDDLYTVCDECCLCRECRDGECEHCDDEDGSEDE